jgi:hypothetical protein
VNDQENKNKRPGGDTHDKSTKSEVTSSGLTGVNNTVRTNDPTEDSASDSAESSESDDDASEDASMEEVQPVEKTGIPSTSDHIEEPNSQQDTLAQPLNNAPRMLGEKDLPLFSDFNAKHNITPADTAIERSANFLERELGGDPSRTFHARSLDRYASYQTVSLSQTPWMLPQNPL